jgi:hypothetical protein
MEARQPSSRIINAYLVFCIFFFIALAGFLVFRVSMTWGANASETRTDFDDLARVSASRYLTAGDFGSREFRSAMRAEVARRPRLLAMVVYSRSEGVRYAYLRDRALMPEPAVGPWTGGPSYAALPWGTRLYRLPYAPGYGTDLAIDGLYVVVGRQDAFPILKETFVILFCFFVLTCIVLLLAPGFAAARARDGRDADDGGDAGEVGAGGGTGAAAGGHGRRSAPPARSRQPEAGGRGNGTPELFSPNTGLGWKEHLDQRLKFELERAASFDQDLVLVVMALDDSDAFGPGDAYADAAAAIRRAFPYQDLTFEHGPGSFALLLPDQDIDGGIESVQRFRRGLPTAISLCSGLSSRNGRLVSGKTLLTEAERALRKARAEGPGRTVAFRADADKYRGVISSRR